MRQKRTASDRIIGYADGMSSAESVIEMLRRHVREGARHVANQHELITRLKQHSLPTADAEALLITFEELQRQHEEHLARVEAEASSRQSKIRPS